VLGKAHELDAAAEIRLHGLRVDEFGQALLSEDARAALRQTKSLLRWLPDLVAWRPAKPRPFLIDAKTCLDGRKTANHSIELRVLLAARFTDLPVFFICDEMKALEADYVWPGGNIVRACCDRCLADAAADPTGRQLGKRCPTHLARGGRGSGTPYVLVARSACKPLETFFGYRLCTTCSTPANKWDHTDRLFDQSSTQCPACRDADESERQDATPTAERGSTAA
jgi:hypothetical protein